MNSEDDDLSSELGSTTQGDIDRIERYDVTDEMIAVLENTDTDIGWLTYGGNFEQQRFLFSDLISSETIQEGISSIESEGFKSTHDELKSQVSVENKKRLKINKIAQQHPGSKDAEVLHSTIDFAHRLVVKAENREEISKLSEEELTLSVGVLSSLIVLLITGNSFESVAVGSALSIFYSQIMKARDARLQRKSDQA